MKSELDLNFGEVKPQKPAPMLNYKDVANFPFIKQGADIPTYTPVNFFDQFYIRTHTFVDFYVYDKAAATWRYLRF
jgi:hypothetical protein